MTLAALSQVHGMEYRKAKKIAERGGLKPYETYPHKQYDPILFAKAVQAYEAGKTGPTDDYYVIDGVFHTLIDRKAKRGNEVRLYVTLPNQMIRTTKHTLTAKNWNGTGFEFTLEPTPDDGKRDGFLVFKNKR